jgi:hypothetical protein
MPVKKKTPMPKSAEKRNVPGASPPQEGKNGQTGRVVSGGKTGSAAREPEPSQMESFEEGMRLFHARKFQQAREFFLQAARGSDRAVAHRAGLHARMCEQRLESARTGAEHAGRALQLRHHADQLPRPRHRSNAPAVSFAGGPHRRSCALRAGRLPEPGWRFAGRL